MDIYNIGFGSSREQQNPSYFQQQLQQQQQQQQQQTQKQKQTQQKTLKRQTSVDSSSTDAEIDNNNADMMSDAANPNITIDKISTMSLGEFKNLLNNALSVPNGEESQCSSDSPRSQSSVDSFKTHQITNKRTTPAKSASNYRMSNMTKNVSSKIITTPARLKNSVSDCSSSGYSNASPATDKPRRSEAWAPNSRSTTMSVTASTNSAVRSVASPRTPNHSVTNSPGITRQSSVGNNRPSSARTTLVNATSVRSVSSTSSTLSTSSTSGYTSRTPATSGCESSNSIQGHAKRSSVAARAGSENSLKSYDNSNIIPDNSYDCHSSQKSDSIETMDDAPSTPSSITSDHSFRNSNYSITDSPGYHRSNSYTPCTAADDRTKWDRLTSDNQRAISEPRDSIVSDTNNGCDIKSAAERPINVGYSSFAHTDNDEDDEMNSELNEIENQMQSEIKNEHSMPSSSNYRCDNQANSTNIKPTPSGRQTPSMIPRPATPKVAKQMSIPLTSENNTKNNINGKDTRNTGRPPTPRKSNIMIRSPSASSAVRGVDSNTDQTYKEIYRKRSLTPGPERRSSAVELAKRSYTPGPGISKTTNLNKTSSTTTRERMNRTMELSKTLPLSIYNDNDANNNTPANDIKVQTTPRSPSNKPQKAEPRGIVRRKSETVILVNREEGKHVLSVENESRAPSNKSKVLARARTEDRRSRTQDRSTTAISKRPQSVEPKQMFRRNSSAVLSVAKTSNGVYDRTTEWVQTAVAQNQVHKPKVTPQTGAARIRRAMTPNSFDIRHDEEEEPRTLEEIKAALTLPINGINTINTAKLDAPPEDAAMFATMEKLFHELRQQELKASVNETPGSNVSSSGSKSKSNHSKSNSNLTDDDVSLDSNKNVKRKPSSVSTQGSSSVTSPTTQNGAFCGSLPQSQTGRPPPASRSVSSSSVSAHPSTPRSTPLRKPPQSASTPSRGVTTPSRTSTTPSRSVNTPVTNEAPPRPSSPSPRISTSHSKPSTPRNSNPPTTTTSPRTPKITRHAPPRTPTQAYKPSSSRVSQPPRPVSSRPEQPPRPSSPANTRKQPPRPASTPPRPSTLVINRQGPKSRDDNITTLDKDNKYEGSANLITKLKEIVKFNPRKDKVEGLTQKTRIPAPKSLAKVGKSKSFSNISSLTNSMALTHTRDAFNNDVDGEMNGYSLGSDIDDGMYLGNFGRSKAFTPLLATPLTTGRSTVIRKDSMNKNDRLVRAVSVERNMSGLQNNYQYYDEGEYL